MEVKKMEKGMKNIFDGFNIKSVRQRLQETETGNSKDFKQPEVMRFTTFVDKMVNERHYGHGNIVFFEKMIEQLEVFRYYFSNTVKRKDILFIDIETLYAYTDWLQRLIRHLDGLRITLEENNLVDEIIHVQMGIISFMTNIVLDIGSIDKLPRVDSLEQTTLDYLLVIEQINIFHKGTLKDLKETLARTKDIIN